MSKGSRIVKVRFPHGLLADTWETIRRRNEHTREAPWDMSEFIRSAVREKIEKMKRGRRRPRKPQSFRCTSCGAEATAGYYHEKDASTESFDTLCPTCAQQKEGDLTPP